MNSLVSYSCKCQICLRGNDLKDGFYAWYRASPSLMQPCTVQLRVLSLSRFRRRDDLDDFLEVVNDPLSSPSKYTALKSTKRSYPDSVSEKPSLEVTRKRTKENAMRSGSGSSPLL